MPKLKNPEPRALVVYYALEMYGKRKSIVLCDAHRAGFYSLHPNACSAGEWKPVTECEYCGIMKGESPHV